MEMQMCPCIERHGNDRLGIKICQSLALSPLSPWSHDCGIPESVWFMEISMLNSPASSVWEVTWHSDHQGISHISVTMVTVTYYYLDHNDDDDHK